MAAGTKGLPKDGLHAALQICGFSEMPSVFGSCLSIYHSVKLTPNPELPEQDCGLSLMPPGANHYGAWPSCPDIGVTIGTGERQDHSPPCRHTPTPRLEKALPGPGHGPVDTFICLLSPLDFLWKTEFTVHWAFSARSKSRS